MTKMKPSFFQIGIILLFSTILLFPSHAFSENIKGSEDEKLKLKEKFIELKSKAQERDTIPVIIGLNTDFKAEGKLIASKINVQKNKIKQDQDSLIGFLSSYKVDNIHKFKHISAIAMNVDKKSLERLESSPLVAMISEDVLFESFLTDSVPLVGAPAAWSNGASGQGQAVAILDTGVEKTHSMLSGKVISEACFSSTVSNPQSTTVCPDGGEEEIGVDTGLPCSANGCDHGTHIAGIAAGDDVSISGVAKDANIIAIQVFSKFPDPGFCNPRGLTAPCVLAYTSDIVKGLDHVMTLANTFDISSVNLSLGGGSYTSEAACDADPYNFFLKQSADNLRSVGIATVASSGNAGSSTSLGSPACISSVISVGSTTKSDAVSSFSNSASFLDLLATGSSITSSILNNQFGVKSGTSMAAPHVAGAWAILKSADNDASVNEILNSLTNTGFPILDSRNGFTFPRIQVDDALNDLVPPQATPWFDTNWQLRKQITINSAQVASTLTNFPVLISITDTDLGSFAQVDGDDILFTAGDGVTQLSHEIESWNDTPDKLVAWVKVPS
ncbi:MAG: S8 family serine peptidase, partial [Thaumarchaeota archaeon]|nr:S8 family serine peptidase [Nitrososphaerota archaeon]